MGIKKYTSFEQARRDQWVFEPGGEYYRRIRNFYQFVTRLNPPVSTPGIFKYRNITEAQERKR
jgi:hypothetical protein